MRTLFLATGAGALAVLVWRFVLAAHGYDVFTRTDTRVDGILYGLMLAMLYHYAPTSFARLQRQVWVWLGVILLALALFRFGSAKWWGASLSYFGADMMGVAILLLLYRPHPGRRHSLVYRLVAWIGLYSYGIYLWHVSVIGPLISFSHRLPVGIAHLFLNCVPAGAGIGLGWMMTKIVEFPALRFRDRVFPREVDSAVGIPAEIERETALRTAPESVFVE